MKLVATNTGWNTITAYALDDKKKMVWRGRQKIFDELVEGEIFDVDVTKRWVFGNTHYVSGSIVHHEINIPALGLEPLPVNRMSPNDREYEMEQVVPGTCKDSIYDPICEAVDLKATGDSSIAYEILLELLATDLRCIDAHVHLGHMRFQIQSDTILLLQALKNYRVGVAMGEFFLGDHFDGLLPWGWVDNRPYLRALQGECLALWALNRFEEAEAVATKWLKLCPDDNLGISFVRFRVQERVPYTNYIGD